MRTGGYGRPWLVPTERTRIGFYLVVGLLLVLNPLAVQAFDRKRRARPPKSKPLDFSGTATGITTGAPNGLTDGVPGRWGLSTLGALVGLVLLARGHRPVSNAGSVTDSR